jgi:hypothetical protein
MTPTEGDVLSIQFNVSVAMANGKLDGILPFLYKIAVIPSCRVPTGFFKSNSSLFKTLLRPLI